MVKTFSEALYYPNIDITDSEWLKTAVLFWDSISTIVPATMEHPYQTPDTRRLFDAGFLRPLRVCSDDDAVVDLSDDMMQLLSSPEILRCSSEVSGLHREKLSYQAREALEELFLEPLLLEPLHPDKLSWAIRQNMDYELRHMDRELRHFMTENDLFYRVNPVIAASYMMALANSLAEKNTLAMITDKPSVFNAGNSLRTGAQRDLLYDRRGRVRYASLAQGLLLQYAIQGIRISSETSIQQLLDFKNRHRDELGKFKQVLAELTKEYDETDEGKPIENLQSEIENIYRNTFLPAYNDLKSALKSCGITSFSTGFLQTATFSVGATTLLSQLSGWPQEMALYAGAGLSVIAYVASYSTERQRILRESPYSYLLSVNNSNIVR